MMGQTVGTLVVVGRAATGPGKARWLCRCSCGAVRIVSGSHLRAARSAGVGLTCCTNRVHRGDVVNALLLTQYKRKCAADKGLCWDLSDDEAIRLFHSPCFYCGRPNVNRRKYRGSEFAYNGIDRIDSAYGYSPGNVVPCCKPCNYAKNEMSQSEFFELIRLIAKRHLKEKTSGKRAATRAQ